jgi:hypothetical protein
LLERAALWCTKWWKEGEKKKKKKKWWYLVLLLHGEEYLLSQNKVYKNVCCIRDKIVEKEGKKKPVPDSPLSGQVADSRQEPSGAGLNCRCSRPRDMPDKAR